jgi:hypothetical protein
MSLSFLSLSLSDSVVAFSVKKNMSLELSMFLKSNHFMHVQLAFKFASLMQFKITSS